MENIQSASTIVVYGYYGKLALNLGDQLFKEAFKHLFPEANFIFTDKLTKAEIKKAGACFIGGGSLVYSEPRMEDGCLSLLENKKIFYIGVGVENIHPVHQQLMKQAQLIAIRNSSALEKVKQLNANSIVIPDLVYSLPRKETPKQDKSVLILPNIETVPKYTSPHYVHSSWAQFKSEFAQFLDELTEAGYTLDFAPMCKVSDLQDLGAIYEIINIMKHRKYRVVYLPESIEKITELFSSYQKVITQRYHGIVLSEIVGTSCISISHHDKLNNILLDSSSVISYYGCYKNKLREEFNKTCPKSSINSDKFEHLKALVRKLL